MRSWNVVRSHDALRRVCVKKERVRGRVEVEQKAAARSRSQRGGEAKQDQQAAAADRERDVAAVVEHHNVGDHSELDGAANAVLNHHERESKKQKGRGKKRGKKDMNSDCCLRSSSFRIEAGTAFGSPSSPLSRPRGPSACGTKRARARADVG